jgi:hypothetical protein
MVENAPIHSKGFNREISAGSIVRLAKPINRVFKPRLSPNTLISAFVEVILGPIMKKTKVTLLGEEWKRIRATEAQLNRIGRALGSLVVNAPELDTVGKLLDACESGQIVRTLGLSDAAELFFSEAFKLGES